MSWVCAMFLVPYNATNVRVRHACCPVVLMPAYRLPSVMSVACVAPSPHCRGSGAGGDQDDAHTSFDAYDRWCKRMEAGEFDPKPGTPGYPARFTKPFLLRSIDKKETFRFFIKEVYGKRRCLASWSWTQKNQNSSYNVSSLNLEILHHKNDCILSIIGFGEIKVSQEMLQSFKGWMKANDFVCISDHTQEEDGNVLEHLVFKLPGTLPGTDLFDAWVTRVMQGGYRHLTHPFLLRSRDHKRTFRFAIYRRPESVLQSCVWTPKQDIDTKTWFQNSQVGVLFEKSSDAEESWEIYISADDFVGCLIIDTHMKREFEAWLSTRAKSKTPKTDPVYYNARGYSYAF